MSSSNASDHRHVDISSEMQQPIQIKEEIIESVGNRNEPSSTPFQIKSESIYKHVENENSNEGCYHIMSTAASENLQLLQPETESERENYSCNYKGVESIIPAQEENTKSKKYPTPLAVYLVNSKGSEEANSPHSVDDVPRNIEIKPDIDAFEFVAGTTDVSCNSSKNNKCESDEENTVTKYPNEDGTISQQCAILSKADNLDLKKHVIIHTKVKRFQCEICEHKSPDSSSLKRHLATHTGEKPFQCQICGNKFTRSSSLKTHLRYHTGEKPFECKVCANKFSVSSHLKMHIRTHTGERPFQCENCGYKCIERSTLRRHMRIHTGEKPFICELCGYKCSVSSSLKLHMRTHTEERPFQCEICEYRFTSSSALVAHVRTHTGEKPFQCEICIYKCTSRRGLKAHLRTHTGEKPYQCEICGNKYTQSCNLKIHMRTHTR